ncbi:MAG: hypothetical protein J7577_23065 [Sphingobacteriaceae bacterium]|nr:hypothetical protein [Sphingobacteriaceae bacterium]
MNNKLTKRVAFIFKRKAMMNLTKEQMRNVRGGDGTTTNIDKPSLEVTCTLVQVPTQSGNND